MSFFGGGHSRIRPDLLSLETLIVYLRRTLGEGARPRRNGNTLTRVWIARSGAGDLPSSARASDLATLWWARCVPAHSSRCGPDHVKPLLPHGVLGWSGLAGAMLCWQSLRSGGADRRGDPDSIARVPMLNAEPRLNSCAPAQKRATCLF